MTFTQITSAPPPLPRRLAVYDNPEPGKPTVERVPFGPFVIHAPRRPTEVEAPDLLRLSRTPGAILK